jgi:hypothetical protein
MQRFLVIFMSMLLLATSGCGEQGDPMWAACNDNIDPDYVKPGATLLIPYHISSKMLGPNGDVICTPRAIREKIKKVLDLYASIPETTFAFKYAGEDTNTYNGNCSDLPYHDGSLRIMLNCPEIGASGTGGIEGAWGPAHSRTNYSGIDYPQYEGGHALFSGSNSLDEFTLLHEIGHALSLDHIPMRGANMSYFGGALNGMEYLSFTEQERADLIGVAPTAAAKRYSISGTPQCLLFYPEGSKVGRRRRCLRREYNEWQNLWRACTLRR